MPVENPFPIACSGGLDQVSPPLSIEPGRVLGALNYECRPRGGYRRIDGYERFDGQPRPHLASYWILDFDTGGSSPPVITNQTVTGATSGATGIAIVDAVVESGDAGTYAGYLVLSEVSGTFEDGENLQVSAATVCVASGVANERGADTTGLDETYILAARDRRRDFILRVPGTGDILGVVMFNNVTYAFRNAAGGGSCRMYRSDSSGGWTFVPLNETLPFDTGTGSEPAEGATVTGGTSGATATIRRVITTSGSWGTDAAGYLVIDQRVGNFSSGESITFATTTDTEQSTILSPSGRYEFRQHNFQATGSKRLYGVDGVNKGFEFDGTTFAQITTGMTTDAPEHLEVHKNYLFYSFAGGSVQHGALGEPLTAWTLVTSGAQEIGTSEDVSGMATLPGGIMAILNRNRTYLLYGSGPSDWDLREHSPNVGGIEWTLQNAPFPMYLDDRGITNLQAVQEFGDFNSGSVSEAIEPFIKARRLLATASCISRTKSQYRLFFSDNSWVEATFDGNQLVGFMPCEYLVPVKCITSEEDSTGAERIFFGSDDGYVYEADVGDSFDGNALEHYLRMPFWHLGQPRIKKRWRRCFFDMEAGRSLTLSVKPEFDYASEDSGDAPLLDTSTAGGWRVARTVVGGGGVWGEADWGDFVWDAQLLAESGAEVNGTGVNMSVLIYGSSAAAEPHTIHGFNVAYSRRGLKRHI